MDYIFVDCSILILIDISKFNIRNFSSMISMFQNTKLISIDVSKFNTQNVNYMKCMFDGCSNLTSIDVYGL